MPQGKKKIAYEYIKGKIISGEYPPLSDISEDTLQDELGISRTPVREAIQRLGEEGFIAIFPRKGTIVTDFSLDMVFWLYEVRELNEPYIFRQACGRLNKKWIDKMLHEFMAFSDENTINDRALRHKYISLDNELHCKVIETCRNVFLRDMMRRVNDHSHRLRVKTSTANQEYTHSIREHLAILQAFQEGDPQKVEDTCRAHILAAKSVAFKYY